MLIYLSIFLVSVFMEFIIFYIILKNNLSLNRISIMEFFAIIIAINAITQFLLNNIGPLIFSISYIYYLVIAEVLIILIEAYLINYIFKYKSIKRALLSSTLANLASWQLTTILISFFVNGIIL